MINIIVGDAVWAQAKVEHKQKTLTEQKKSVTADKKSAPKTDKKTEKKSRTKPSKIKPTIPGADRHKKGRVFLEYCDRLYMDPNISTEYQVLSGNVKFRKGDMFMYCDSAY
ncbi:MAG: OstA-like protein, partial [Candidatus Limisoma sp.]